MEKYKIIISPRVIEQIKNIRDYIANVKLSPETADRLVTAIFDEIESLEVFPERGFNADEKIGTIIDRFGRSSRGITIQNGKYIVIYSIDKREGLVEVAFLFSSKTDYAKLFL
ncbi:TPA: type II toxin-antitoxin system RelE/ParE family toxin [Streptococcus suis]